MLCCTSAPNLQAFKLLITDKQKLAGLERSTLAVAAQKAKEAGHKNATTDKGPWMLTLDFSTYAAVVTFAKDRELRKKMYTAYRSLASTGKTDNAPIIRQILQGRREMSGLLGYPNFAELSLSSKVGLQMHVLNHKQSCARTQLRRQQQCACVQQLLSGVAAAGKLADGVADMCARSLPLCASNTVHSG
jgi:Zn-dependent oligopeptidase